MPNRFPVNTTCARCQRSFRTGERVRSTFSGPVEVAEDGTAYLVRGLITNLAEHENVELCVGFSRRRDDTT